MGLDDGGGGGIDILGLGHVEFGAMGLEGAVKLGFRKELEATPAADRQALFDRLLAEAIERGEALKRRCDELLRQAEARVDKITTDASGKVTGTEPLDVQ